MDGSVMSRVVAPVVALAAVLTLGVGVAHGAHGSAAHAGGPVSSSRDRGWCC